MRRPACRRRFEAARSMLPRWPRSPKPVMSVAAVAPAASIASAACAVERRHRLDRAASTIAGAALRFTAVVSTPVPIGLVSTSTSPGRAPALVMTRSGWIVPVTNSPNFGSSSTIEWPPAMAMPAAADRRRAVETGAAARCPAIDRPGDEAQRIQRRAAHGVDVAERVGGGDAAVVEGVVDDRREDVDRLDQGQVVAQPDDGRVVATSCPTSTRGSAASGRPAAPYAGRPG